MNGGVVGSRRLLMLVVSGLAVLGVGCKPFAERAYDSLSEMNGTGDEPILAMTSVPSDAVQIKVMTSVESSEYYISYQTSDVGWAPGTLGMSAANGLAWERSMDSLGFGVKFSPDADIHGLCRKLGRPAMPVRMEGNEVLLLADDHGRQHQWNVRYDEELEESLCV